MPLLTTSGQAEALIAQGVLDAMNGYLDATDCHVLSVYRNTEGGWGLDLQMGSPRHYAPVHLFDYPSVDTLVEAALGLAARHIEGRR
jgi:hypothetical protein